MYAFGTFIITTINFVYSKLVTDITTSIHKMIDTIAFSNGQATVASRWLL